MADSNNLLEINIVEQPLINNPTGRDEEQIWAGIELVTSGGKRPKIHSFCLTVDDWCVEKFWIVGE